jgi:hypothetical protein
MVSLLNSLFTFRNTSTMAGILSDTQRLLFLSRWQAFQALWLMERAMWLHSLTKAQKDHSALKT